MHWAWWIVNQQYDPQAVPARDGVDIRWDHVNAEGDYDAEASVAAAREMVSGYGMSRLSVAPSLTSRHIEGNAIDMTIGWEGDFTIEDADGNQVRIVSKPREDLHAVGESYGVVKFHGGARDRPHWSNDGR